jgi:hypothetical protein
MFILQLLEMEKGEAMRKFLVLILLLTISIPSITFGSQPVLTGVISFGNGYNSEFVSVLFVRPNSLNFGADLSVFNFEEKSTTSRAYYGALYTQNKLFQKDVLSVDWLVGVTYSKSDYSSFSSDAVTTPGMGIAGKYVLSPRWSIDGKAVAVIYSDGFAVPYNVGITYPVKKVDVSLGVQGLLTTISSGGNSSSSNSYGLMLGAKY